MQNLRTQSKNLQHHSPPPPVDPTLTVDHITTIAAALDGPDVQHLGVFTDEAAAAMAYDRAAIARLGCHAPTNFDLSCYRGELGEAAYAQALTLGLLGTKPMAPDSSAIEGPLQGPFDAALDNVMPSLSPLLGGVGDESPSMHSMQAAASAAVWQQLSSETPTSRSA